MILDENIERVSVVGGESPVIAHTNLYAFPQRNHKKECAELNMISKMV